MVIRMTGSFDFEAIDDLATFTQVVNIIHEEILEEVLDEIEPDLITELSEDAPPVARPIQWTSERQRRAYFATDGFGAGIPYRRTGKLRKAWIVEIRGNAIVVENPSEVSKFVYGSLAQNRSQALRFQQRFHVNTGWQPATDTVKKHLDRAGDLYIEKFDDRLAGMASGKTKRRAFTKGARRT